MAISNVFLEKTTTAKYLASLSFLAYVIKHITNKVSNYRQKEKLRMTVWQCMTVGSCVFLDDGVVLSNITYYIINRVVSICSALLSKANSN